MALLKNPHWEVIPPLLRDLLAEIGQEPFARRFYLAGGTALALRLGHRVSVDLDFFSESDNVERDTRIEITTALQRYRSVQVVEDAIGNLLLQIEGIHVGFFSYGYPLLELTDDILGIRVASLVDIGLMKLDAVATRGARKDFYDLYFIAQAIPLEELLEKGAIKYPHTRDFGMLVLTALVDFDVADQQTSVETHPPVSWEAIKNFFIGEVQRIGNKWFESGNLDNK